MPWSCVPIREICPSETLPYEPLMMGFLSDWDSSIRFVHHNYVHPSSTLIDSQISTVGNINSFTVCVLLQYLDLQGVLMGYVRFGEVLVTCVVLCSPLSMSSFHSGQLEHNKTLTSKTHASRTITPCAKKTPYSEQFCLIR